jgi:phosphoserine aminotransferase
VEETIEKRDSSHARKNLGPAGLTTAIIRDRLLGRVLRDNRVIVVGKYRRPPVGAAQ